MTEQEWMTIYRGTVRDLYGYVARRTGGIREISEDVVQEAYLRALGDWRTKRIPDSPLAWLKHVARNVLIDYLRQKQWIRPADAGFPSEAGADRRDDGFRALEIGLAISSLGRKKAAAKVKALEKQAKRFQDLQTLGLVPIEEVRQTQYALEAAQFELKLAVAELDILKKAR